MRYPVGGACSTAISPATASSNQLLGPAMNSDRNLWIRGIYIYPNATNGPLIVCDATVGSTATQPVVQIPLPTNAGGDDIKVVTFPAPGLKFKTNPVCHLDASGSIGIGECGYTGYEES